MSVALQLTWQNKSVPAAELCGSHECPHCQGGQKQWGPDLQKKLRPEAARLASSRATALSSSPCLHNTCTFGPATDQPATQDATAGRDQQQAISGVVRTAMAGVKVLSMRYKAERKGEEHTV